MRLPPRIAAFGTAAAKQPLTPAWSILLGSGAIGLLTVALLVGDAQQATALLLYVLVVLAGAIRFGLGAGLVSAVLASVAFNYFFLTPRQAFGLTSFEDGVRLLTFLSVALLAGSLAGRAHTQAHAATRRADELAALLRLSQAISAEVLLERILPRVAEMAREMLRVPACQILLHDPAGTLVLRAAAGVVPPNARSAEHELYAMERRLGVLRVALPVDRPTLDPDETATFETIAAQVVLVLERARLADAAAHARALAESDQLKTTLLSSVSHDLRTPLTLIKAAATNLLDETVPWDGSTRRELLVTIDRETDRLNRLVGDLLEMSRIEAGAIQLRCAPQDIDEIVAHVVARLQPQMPQQRILARLPEELPPVLVSYAQIEQVLTNLIENAAQYAPAGSQIEIRATSAVTHLQVEVLDQGPGVPAALRERIFDKFVRAAPPERSAEGSGLGLAICKGLVEAHGGRIWVAQTEDRRTCFAFTLPRYTARTATPAEALVPGSLEDTTV